MAVMTIRKTKPQIRVSRAYGYLPDVPKRANPGDAGLDLESYDCVSINPGQTAMVHTGLRVEIPEGYFGMVVPRSGLASKRGLAPINSPGIIDSGYRGEIMVALHNFNVSDENGNGAQFVAKGDRIAQLVIVPYLDCDCVMVDPDELDETERGEGGFGSSGA